jgi:type II secretory pathway pseudopilin PulG
MNRGFSLLEVMVSGALLIVGVTAALQGYSTATQRAIKDRHLTQAIHAAESAAESVLAREQSDGDLNAGNHPDMLFFDDVGHELPSAAGASYVASWSINANTPIENIRRIAITVRWTDSGGGGTTLMVHRR